ncbi:transposable element Tcb2 transposase [Trichonephila clavipes]|nr:transposable element Tcb2 transposase [Trichonephila clavipes]
MSRLMLCYIAICDPSLAIVQQCITLLPHCWDNENSFVQEVRANNILLDVRKPSETIGKVLIVGVYDESRFNINSDDNSVRVWRPRGERLNLAFALQRHTAPTAGVIVWNAIACNTWSPLVLIRSTMTAQWYVYDILQPHVLLLMQRLSGAIFQQDNARPHTTRVSQDCLRTVTTLPSPARSPDLSPIEHIWDQLGR